MAIVRWEPFRDLVATQDRFNRLFNGAFSNVFGEENLTSRAWAPPVDIYETDHDLVLKAELPGIDPKDLDIRVENGTLYLKGERKHESETKEENYHRIERSYGSFVRTFALPNSISTENVKADYKDGVLTLTMAKREEAKPKTIKVNVGESA
ncbi:MAG TPA: Hsp20/alpha crystallin family protein [Terriglobia bacterium]|nr:Hsp20/alpha crystallin family protein [Terriglobia bacterium]